MNNFVIPIDKFNIAGLMLAGGKGANLGELNVVKDLHVPGGFVVTTDAYRTIYQPNKKLHQLLNNLSGLNVTELSAIRNIGEEIRSLIDNTPIPEKISREIVNSIHRSGNNFAWAIRSSATAEDLPTASFAGQQDSFLNIKGDEEILKYIRKCWASLFNDHAIIYRIQNGFSHRHVYLAVIIQKMINAEASGVMFTADPVNFNRKIISIDAVFGLGEGLVSGKLTPDNYRLAGGNIISKTVAKKTTATQPSASGGISEIIINQQRQSTQVLTDRQMQELEELGRKIEAHLKSPQDIEWCLADNKFYIVQSRPITTLYPLPRTTDNETHVYVSSGHQQMMTDAMKPLGISMYLLTTVAPMQPVGGRLYVDIARQLATEAGRDRLINVLGKNDPLTRDALLNIIQREEFAGLYKEELSKPFAPTEQDWHFKARIENEPKLVEGLILKSQALFKKLQSEIDTKSGNDLLDFILADLQELKKALFDPQSIAVIFTGMEASAWLNERIQDWLGETNVADIISLSVPNNITSEMGLALMEVADIVRPYPEVIQCLEEQSSSELFHVEGGEEASKAINNFLAKYGMRGSGEIDITRERWSEKPESLYPAIINNIKMFGPGAAHERFTQGRVQAENKKSELIARLIALPDGDEKARETERVINLIRNFIGYREYPKYGMINRYFIYKKALLKEAIKLRSLKIIQEPEDIFFLDFEELRQAMIIKWVDKNLIEERKSDYHAFRKLSPPRVMTSDGEVITGSYKRENLPERAIPGLAVSSGTVEGRARVILDMTNADLAEGDILVTKFTDPGWTPVFLSIKGLVTEVGGLMSHGSVIAREYGLPAVVGVENATILIKDGQIIRVNGTNGYVQVVQD